MPIGLGIGLNISMRGGLASGFSLDAPVLAWDTGVTDNTPTFSLVLTAPEIDDVITLQWSATSDFSVITDTDTYTVLAADLIDLECEFTTGTLADGAWYFRSRHSRGASNSAWSNTETKTIATAVAPANTVAPAVTGTAVEGYTLTTTDGTWTGTATITYSYQWKRGVTNIGADQNTYVLVAADEGQNITCTVTATNGVGSDDAVSNTVAVFDPTALFASTEKGFIIDPTRISTLWKDTAGTSAVTADNDVVARVDDRSDNAWNGVQSTSGNRPRYNTSTHPLGALAFATDDWLDFTASSASVFQAASYGTIIAFANLSTLGAQQVIFYASRNALSSFRLGLTVNASNQAVVTSRRLDADSGQTKASTATVTGAGHVLTAEADWAGTSHQIQIDLNAAESATPTWGAGSATSNTASSEVPLGALGATATSPATGDIGRAIVINRQLTSDEKTAAIKWCGKGGGMSL